jgi:Flp pilus assembly protein protease CpaA
MSLASPPTVSPLPATGEAGVDLAVYALNFSNISSGTLASVITAMCGSGGTLPSSPATLKLTGAITSDELSKVGHAVRSAGKYVNLDLTEVTGLSSIGDNAFLGCTSLTSVTIPNTVISIGDYAFQICTSLPSVTIPDSVTSIGICAFMGCFGLASVTIPDSVTSIGDMAFMDCSGLASVTIPNTVITIGIKVFDACTSLTSITIGAGMNCITSDSGWPNSFETYYAANNGSGAKAAGTYTWGTPTSGQWNYAAPSTS